MRFISLSACCPHARGDGPHTCIQCAYCDMLSPRTWGWSKCNCRLHPPKGVVPTHVGMVQRAGVELPYTAGCPHARGDGPPVGSIGGFTPPLSPRTWGWSEIETLDKLLNPVVPTHVGMVRIESAYGYGQGRCPHARGDGPDYPHIQLDLYKLSPRTWGWSVLENGRGFAIRVVPTHVGMVRLINFSLSLPTCCPHARGDGPR